MKSVLHVADDFRTLNDGKLMALGLYADNVVLINREAKQLEALSQGAKPALDKLALLLTIRGLPAGEHTIVPRVLLPDGQEQGTLIEPFSFPIREDRSVNFIFNLAPFVIPQYGDYTLSASVGDFVIDEKFTIGEAAE